MGRAKEGGGEADNWIGSLVGGRTGAEKKVNMHWRKGFLLLNSLRCGDGHAVLQPSCKKKPEMVEDNIRDTKL